MHGTKRIFFDGELNEVIELPEDVSRRLKTVLRAQTGDEVEILTRSSLARGVIGVVGKKSVSVKIDSVRDVVKPGYSFTAYQCIAKREYMDFIVEKYAELGVTKFIPVISSRSLSDFKDNTLKRLETIAIEAAIQCENEFVMEITTPLRLEKIKCGEGVNILFYERGSRQELPPITNRTANILIGPEGGFTEKEVETLVTAGFISVTPVKSILKAETAAVLFGGLVRMELDS